MAWARFDDEYPRHPKIQRIPAEHRADAMALELSAVCYSTKVLTDGFVSRAVVETLGLEVGFESKRGLNRRRLRTAIDALERAKRWVSVQGGWQIHDYADYQPSASEVTERRRVERDKKRKQRENRQTSLDVSLGDKAGDANPVSPSVSPGDTSHVPATRAHAPAHPGPSHTHRPSEQKGLALTADRSETTANGLPVEKERLTVDLLAAIGKDADAGTPTTVRRYAAQLPEGALAKVLESVRQSKARHKARYVVGALKDELEAVAPRSRSAKLRGDPEAWVREVGHKMPADVFEEALAELLPENEDERIRLADLAADLRAESAA
jgi:hypothetical protein